MLLPYVLLLLAALSLGVHPGPAQEQSDLEEELWHYRNLGKAFYENPTTQYEAVEQFKKALDLAPDSPRELLNYGLSLIRAGRVDEGVATLEKVQQQAPGLPHSWFNLGIVYKKRADYKLALEQFERMVELVPDEPISRYNLGVLYRLTGDAERSLKEFELTAALDPNLAGPQFQLYNAYRAAGRDEESARALEIFNSLKKRNAGAAIPEDLEWSFYSEVYDTVEPRELSEPLPVAELSFKVVGFGDRLEGKPLGLELLDVDGDGSADVLVWSESELRVYPKVLADSPWSFTGLSGVVSAAAGDLNNDGLSDLCVVTAAGPVLMVSQEGKLVRSQVTLPEGSYVKALWHDFDHDSDIDLFLFGRTSALLRNNGKAGFSDLSRDFPFVKGEVLDAAPIDLVKDSSGSDLLVTFRDRSGVVYKDRLGGQFVALEQPRVPALTSRLLVHDLDNDGWTDVLAVGPRPWVAFLNKEGALEPSTLDVMSDSPVCLVDLENRGLVDLVAGGQAYANLGLGRVASGRPLPQTEGAVALAGGDFNGDGRSDLILLTREGRVDRLDNQTRSGGNWVQIALQGVRNPVLAPNAEVEVKAGTLYQKKVYRGLPLDFGLGVHDKIDAVRITWPNGLIQNELQLQAGESVAYKEAQRLSGSCPMIFTWNGEEFEFITDVLGVAPLGASSGNGEYFPVDHDEYIQIPGSSLAERDGLFELRITEELREVSYLDQVRLIALDHPDQVSVFTNEKFTEPPFPEFRLYGVRERHYPVTARDGHGSDVRESLLRSDRRYPDAFARDYNGVAELHSLELDFGADSAKQNRSILVLHGWVDWADGSTFLRAMQEGSELVLPYLQVQDAEGSWKTVIEDMGLPAGKPKTIVVDLTGKFLSGRRKVRIVTNLCVYWDEVFLGEDTESPPVRLQDVPLLQADLRFRGFSTPVIHPERKQPEAFLYSRWMPVSMWNQTPGNYTRYGGVHELAATVDDRFVILGSGDELRLLFRSDRLPPVKEGWTRDFLLLVDGWAKDGDLNTAFSTSVEPLPFHGMSRYPYPAGESYPNSEFHRRYIEEYNIRPALRLLGRLTPGRSQGMTSAPKEGR